MDVILYGLITVLLALAVFQAFRLHKHYTKTLYPALFANYLEYFWRYQFRQNLSVSSWLKQELGFHRLLYNSVLDQNGHVAQTYVTLLCTRGAFVIRDVRSEGQISGKPNDKHWIVSRPQTETTKNFRIPNPADGLRQHCQYQRQALGGVDCAGLCAFPDAVDLTHARSEFALLHYKDVVSWIKDQPEQMSEPQILTAFENVSKK